MIAILKKIRKGLVSVTEMSRQENIPKRTLRRYVKRSRTPSSPFFVNIEKEDELVDTPPDGLFDTPPCWKPQTCVPRFQLPLPIQGADGCPTKKQKKKQCTNNDLHWNANSDNMFYFFNEYTNENISSFVVEDVFKS